VASAADPDERATPPPPDVPSEGGGTSDETSVFATPLFPEADITNAVRIQLRTFIAPEAAAGSGHVTVTRPELSTRATWPVNERTALRIDLRLAEAHYSFHGDVWGPALTQPSGSTLDPDRLINDLDLHSVRLALEGARRIGSDTSWLANGEQWSVVGSGSIGSRWEDSNFDGGLGAGGGVGVGYEIPGRLRAVVGISLRSPLDDADFDIDPYLSLRWRQPSASPCARASSVSRPSSRSLRSSTPTWPGFARRTDTGWQIALCSTTCRSAIDRCG